MIKTVRALLLLAFFVPSVVFGEGSKQLTPNKSTSSLTSTLNDKAGYLAHDANFPSATGVAVTSLSFLKPAGFSRNGATYSKEHRLYIRVKAGETLYYGVHRAIHDQTTANQANLTITLRRVNAATGAEDATFNGNTGFVANTLTANTSSTRDMLLTANQNGVIDNATEAQNGPNRPALGGKAAVTTGYTPLSTKNTSTTTDYDYYVEFTQAGESTWTDDGRRFSVYDLWDFTVINATGDEKPGRMRSKLWSFSAGGADNVFSKDFNMYPLIPSLDQTNKYFVKKIELAGIAPQNFFRFVTNRYGSDASVSASVTERRKSQLASKDYPEFFNFVNNPDVTEWPSAAEPVFNVTAVSSCNPNSGGGKTVFTVSSSESSTLMVLVNLNNTAGYQPKTTDVLLEQSGDKGTRTFEWNGLNGLGQAVPSGTSVTYYFRNGCGSVHFPMWDAEINNGFRVEDVRPLAGSNYGGLLFWDDSNLPLSTFPDPQTQLFGVESTTDVHAWGNASTGSIAGDLKTVNTWSYGYTNSTTQTTTFTYDCSADVAVTNVAAVSSGAYVVGKNIAYTIIATNNGPLPATNVVITDLLDAAKLQFVSADNAAYNSTTGKWTIGTMPVGTSSTLLITAKPLVTGPINTTAAQTHTETDNVSANNTAVNTVTVVPSADIEVKNTASKTVFNNGDLVTYTITAKNVNGPNAATGVVVTDKLPAGLTLEGTVPVGYNAATGEWAVGTLAINETKTLTLNARISTLGSISNTATLGSRTGYEADENASNNVSSNTISVNPTADVSLTNTVSNATPNQNQTITYTLRAKNNGPNNASSVVVSGAVPAGVTFSGFLPTIGTVSITNGILTWNVGTIAVDSTQRLVITAVPTATGSQVFTVSQTHTENDNVAANNTASQTINVQPRAEIQVTNVITSPAPAGGVYTTGDVVTYLVEVKNNGPSAATNVNVTDLLPATLTNISYTASTGTYNPATGIWPVGTLANGASATLSITATIAQSAVITTTASQTHTENDNVSGNNSASSTIQSGSGVITADVAVSVTTPATSYYTGDAVNARVVATNNGPDAATNVAIQVPVPAGMTLAGFTANIGSYANGIWTIPTLASGSFASFTLNLVPATDANTAGDKNYTITAGRTGTFAQIDNVVTNNAASANIVVHKKAEVATTIAVSSNDPSGKYYNGISEATFSITVTNNGPDEVTGLKGTDTRTGTINFTGVQAPTGTTYSFLNGIWDVGTLAAGASKTLIVKGIPNTVARLNLGGTISAQDQYDGVLANNSAVALLNVLPAADLAVTNIVSSANSYNNSESKFTVTLQNNGANSGTGVQVAYPLPTGLSFVSAVASAGTYDQNTGKWTLGSDVLPGAANAQTLVVTVKPQAAGTYYTTASVQTANEYDQVAINNSQQDTLVVAAAADIALSSAIEAGPYYIGTRYAVTVTVKNNGPDAATGVVVGSAVATGLRLVPGSGTPDAGTTINPVTGLWTVGTLAVNESKNLTLLVEPIAFGNLNNSGFKYASNEFDPNGGTTKNGNNTTLINFAVTDREATYQVLLANKHILYFATGQHIAVVTDADGIIQNAKVVAGSLPAGVTLQNNGEIEITDNLKLVPGSYSFTVETVDEYGGISQNVVAFTISGDWDGDGVDDITDIDDNNDGITDLQANMGVDPLADADNDQILNFIDPDFIHPVYGTFRDRNSDGINDVFDTDLDGVINSLDIDIDDDGITNVIEANKGKIPAGSIYNTLTGIITGSVSANGMPDAAQTAANSGVSAFAIPDTDGDGYPDFLDADSDNDGISDNTEAQSTLSFISKSLEDTDRDGLNNYYDPSCGCNANAMAILPLDFDHDGIPDYLDTDSDEDLFEDFIEAFTNDKSALAELKLRAANFESANAKGYYTTADSNNNGIPNWLENYSDTGKPAYLVKASGYFHDADMDGIADLFDTDSGGRNLAMQADATSGEYSFRNGNIGSPLPVKLVQFNAVAQEQHVKLTWATATEKDNAYFEIERSADGKTFVKISEVAGNGTSNQLLQYGFLDTKAPMGINYYRLKQVDLDGKSEYSKVVSVNLAGGAKAENLISVFPNPAALFTNLDLSNLPAQEYAVTLINATGQSVRIFQTQDNSVFRMSLENLPAGKYLIRVTGKGVLTTMPLLKN